MPYVFEEIENHLADNNKTIDDIEAIKVFKVMDDIKAIMLSKIDIFSDNKRVKPLFAFVSIETESEKEHFNKAILYSKDVWYDSYFGSQEIFGYIWYKDGSWSERNYNCGEEWWEYKQRPNKNLTSKDIVI